MFSRSRPFGLTPGLRGGGAPRRSLFAPDCMIIIKVFRYKVDNENSASKAIALSTLRLMT